MQEALAMMQVIRMQDAGIESTVALVEIADRDGAKS